ncbi:MAG TPA: alanyl-tRNA editing protein [Firmicutes bacterium]|nr:alanyl-tRNA editing protein [Candidatus Fermentithermobacillaceae bacterium]
MFYPEGGGQPSDHGVIQGGSLPDTGGSCRVIGHVGHVFEEAGRVVHVLSPGREFPNRALKKGQVVYGKIDWARRFDFMQQHTGQHILSRAFEEICSANTAGFHLGDDYVSIDLDVQSVDDSQLTAVEDLVNEVIFKNVPVEAREYEQGEVPDSIRRRIPTESGAVRICYVGGFDACACGGTHVQSTGEVGIIKVNQLDRSHGGVRVIFRCGKRALLDFREKEKVLDNVARSLSVGYKDLPGAVVSLSEKAADLDKEVGRLKKQLLEYEIESFAREIRSDDVGRGRQGLGGQEQEQEHCGAEEELRRRGYEGMPETSLSLPDFQQERWIARGRDFAVCKSEGKQPAEIRFMARSVSELTGKMVVLFSPVPQFSLAVASPVVTSPVAAPQAPDGKSPGTGRGSKSRKGSKRQRASDIPPSRNASLLVSKLAQRWGLRGGGAPQLAQMGSKKPLSRPVQDILNDIAGVMDELG